MRFRSWIRQGARGAALLAIVALLSSAVALGADPFRLTLDAAYRLALASDERIRIAERELRKAELLPWRAASLMAPRAEISASYTRAKDDLTFSRDAAGGVGGENVVRPEQAWQGELSATQPIFRPELLPTLRLGDDTVERRLDEYRFTIRDVLFGVGRAYYDVLRAGRLVEVSRRSLELAAEELEHARVRLRVGEVVRTDVLRAEVGVERARRDLVRNEGLLEASRRTLARLTGAEEPLSLEESPPSPVTEGDAEELIARAIEQREDLRAAEKAIRIAEAQRGLILARYAPTVEAEWRYPRIEKPTFSQPDEFWTLVLSFSVPLFDGGARELDLAEAGETVRQVRFERDRLRKDVELEVERALIDVRTLVASRDASGREVDLAEQEYAVTSKSYRVGVATSLDVSTALTNLDRARTNLANETYDLAVARLALERVLGSFGERYVEGEAAEVLP